MDANNVIELHILNEMNTLVRMGLTKEQKV